MGKGDSFKARIIDAAVIPMHPVVPHLYTLPAQSPAEAKWLTVLDLRNAFFCIPVYPDLRFLFAFEHPTNATLQLTWTIFLRQSIRLSQGCSRKVHRQRLEEPSTSG